MLAPPGMPKTVSTPSCSSAFSSASAPDIFEPVIAPLPPRLDRTRLDPAHVRLQTVRQVSAGALELPRGPVAPAHLQHVLLLLVAEVETRAQIDHVGGQVAVDDGARRGSANSTLTWPGPSHSTLATTVPSRSNSYRMRCSPCLRTFARCSRSLGLEAGNEKPRGCGGVRRGQQASWAWPRLK